MRGKHVLLSLGNPNDRPFVEVIKVGADVAFSLETEDRLIAEARQANGLDHFKRLFQLAEADPISLSHRNLVALSGEAYRVYATPAAESPKVYNFGRKTSAKILNTIFLISIH